MTTEKLQDKIIHREIDTGVFGAIQEDDKLELDDVKQKLSDLKKELKEGIHKAIGDLRGIEFIDEAFAKHIGDKLGGGK